MKYDVRVGDRTFEVEVEGARVRVGNREFPASLTAVPHTPFRRLAVPGASCTFAFSRTREGWTLHRAGRSWLVEIVDERAKTVQRLVGRPPVTASDGSVRAPMPGLVLRIEVAEGQSVDAGAGLVVLEAMKMENEIRAPAAGVVRRILVSQGQAVEKGSTLLELDRQG